MFGHHKAVLDELDRFVRSRSMEEVPSYIRIDGSTSADDRQANVEKFQKEEGCRIALLSIMAAGTGITLHAASHVVFAELHWTPAYLVQAEDRGQTRTNEAEHENHDDAVHRVSFIVLYVSCFS